MDMLNFIREQTAADGEDAAIFDGDGLCVW